MTNLLKRQLIGNGKFGKYFRISDSRGVKIVGRGFKSKKNVRKSDQLAIAAKEATYLKIAQPFKVTPRIYGVTIAKYQGKYYPAIEMEHLCGILAFTYDKHGSFKVNALGRIANRGRTAEKYLKDTLFRAKIIHTDLHYNNMIVNNRTGIKAVDFSPAFVRYKGDKNYFSMIHESLLTKARSK